MDIFKDGAGINNNADLNIPYGNKRRGKKLIQLNVQERAATGINEIEVDDEPNFFEEIEND